MNGFQASNKTLVWRKRWPPVMLGAAALALSALALKLPPIPYVWIACIYAVTCVAAIALLSRPWSRPFVFLFLNASLVALALAATEAIFYWREGEPVYSEGYRDTDDALGFVPVKAMHAHSSKIDRGQRLYDVGYSIDSSGLRVAPPVDATNPAACILFFGDSFMFGEGLNDDETLPYQVGVQSGRQFRTYNFGFHGYGPHQMLAAIESGVLQRVIHCAPNYAIYQAIPDHVARVAGKVPYGKHAPRYQLEPGGEVRVAGHFDDGARPLPSRIKGNLEKSAIFRWFVNATQPAVSDDDVRLMLEIVGSANRQLAAQHPGIQFHVILWVQFEKERALYEKLRRGLRDRNVPVHLVENILPDYHLGASRYVLSSNDRHPTALTNRMLADYVVNRIVRNQASVADLHAAIGR